MDSTTAPVQFELLTDDELTQVVGGDVRNFDAKDFTYNKIGMCGCGFAH